MPVRRFRGRSTSAIRSSSRRGPTRVFQHAAFARRRARLAGRRGADSPALLDYIAKHAADYDYVVFFSYRYYHAYHGARAAPARAILVPTAERDASDRPVDLPAALPRRPRDHVQLPRRAGDDSRGLGQSGGPRRRRRHRLGVPNNPQPARFRQKYGIRGPFAVYVGRIDREQGLQELFEFFQAYLADPCRQALARARSATRCCRFPIIRASGTSAFSTTPTSSTRWRPPIC